MSEYKIVNRVAPTPAMAQAIADVEAEDKARAMVSADEVVSASTEISQPSESGLVDPDIMNKPLPVVTNPLFDYNPKTGMPAGTEVPKLQTEFHVPVPKAGDEMKIPFHAGETIKFVETAEASRAPFVGKVDLIGEQTEEAIKAFFAGLDKPVSREEFEQLKQNLIEAFKVMGFDMTRLFA